MMRMWIGIGLLAGILIGGIWLWLGLGSIHGSIAEDLEQAAGFALQEDWEQAAVSSRQAAAQWERCKHITAAFTDHAPMEQIDALFAELEVYARMGTAREYAVVCKHLSRLAEAVRESMSLKWWTLL